MKNILNSASSSLDFAQLGELKGRAKRKEDSALRETTEQFEAMFLQMMLKTMRDATPRSGFLDSDTVKTYESMYDRELALHLARKNSVGIADMLVESLSNNNSKSETEGFLLQHPGGVKGMPLNGVEEKHLKFNQKIKSLPISRPEPSAFPLRQSYNNGIKK